MIISEGTACLTKPHTSIEKEEVADYGVSIGAHWLCCGSLTSVTEILKI